MLVLSRKPDESIVLTVGNTSVELLVLGYRGDQVRLGFSAPSTVNIVRSELIDRTDSASPIRTQPTEESSDGSQ